MTVSDAPSCGITYDCHSDNFRGVNYNRNIFKTNQEVTSAIQQSPFGAYNKLCLETVYLGEL
jgi:hypothetical protein